MQRNQMIRRGLPLAMLILGLMLGGLWPKAPLHAVATDRLDTFIMCTGAVDDTNEAVYCLDCLTGDVIAAVAGRVPNQFGAVFHYNVMKDFGIDPSKNPKFLMVSGTADLAYGGGRVQPSRAKLYVAEVTSGMLIAYTLPWDRSSFNSGHPIKATLQPLARLPIRQSQPNR